MNKSNRAFTLIELLVVVAIIGILASVVLASLSSARDKGKEAAIISDLKNMMPQAELSYSNVNPNNYSTACTGVAKMLTGIAGVGGTAACYSYNNSGTSDVNLRWGATAKNGSGTKNWSVDPDGVVTWGTVNVGSTSTAWDVASGTATMNWPTATSVCAAVGGKLPSLEELKALYDAYGTNPTGYTSGGYWSSTTVPSDSTDAYVVSLTAGNGGVNVGLGKVAYPGSVRCVR